MSLTIENLNQYAHANGLPSNYSLSVRLGYFAAFLQLSRNDDVIDECTFLHKPVGCNAIRSAADRLVVVAQNLEAKIEVYRREKDK